MFMKADELLKEATVKKNAGDLESAIRLLREAFEEIGKTPIIYSVQTFLRLPLYLQIDKRNDEAWAEFNRLLIEGYPNQMADSGVLSMEHSIIYDKMRLFLEREKKHKMAIRFDIFSYFSWAIGLYIQNRKEELVDFISKDFIKQRVEKMLHEDEKEVINRIIAVIEIQLKKIPDINFATVGKEIDSAMITVK